MYYIGMGDECRTSTFFRQRVLCKLHISPRTWMLSTHNTDALLVSCIHPNVGISEQVISFAGQIAMQSTSLRYVPLSFTPSLQACIND